MKLHVVGRVTAAVARFIGPGLQLLQTRGERQHLLALDDQWPQWLSRSLPAELSVTTVRARQWSELGRAYEALLSRHRFSAVHFHGVRPWLVGESVHWRLGHWPQTVLSPHGSRLLPVLPGLLALTGRTAGAQRRPLLIATSALEAARLQARGLIVSATHPVVEPDYFSALPQTGGQALVASGSYAPEHGGAERFAQLAVLLGSVHPGLRFLWLGGGRGLEQLDAAGVQLSSDLQPQTLNQALASVWVFTALTPDPRLPLLLAQAMASGLACVALHTPSHAGLIRHGHNGLLVRDDDALRQAVCVLLDRADLRQRLGRQARRDAFRTFGPHQFARGLLRGYEGDPWHPALTRDAGLTTHPHPE